MQLQNQDPAEKTEVGRVAHAHQGPADDAE